MVGMEGLREVRGDMVLEEEDMEVEVGIEEVGDMVVHRTKWVDTMIVGLLRDIMVPHLIEENGVAIVIEGIGLDREIGLMDDGNEIVEVVEEVGRRIRPRLIGDTKGAVADVITAVEVAVGIVGIGETISRTVVPPSCPCWNSFPCLGNRHESALLSRSNKLYRLTPD